MGNQDCKTSRHNNLKFHEHLSNIHMKANRKLTALTRLRNYLDTDKMRILF